MATKPAKKQLSNNNLLIVLLLVTLLVIGGAVLVGKVLITDIVRNTKVLSAQSTANKNLDADLNAAPQLVDQYGQLSSSASILADALPTTQDFSGLLVELEAMAGSAGITLKSVAPSQTVAVAIDGTTPTTTTKAGSVPTPQNLAFTVSVAGNYASLQKLFDAFEKSARPMRVTGAQLSGSGSQLTAELTMTTYYQDKAQLPFSKETIK